MAGIGTFLKADKQNIKQVVGGILGGEEVDELDFVKSYDKFTNMDKHAKRFRDLFVLLTRTRTFDKFPHQRILTENYINILEDSIRESFGSYDKDMRRVKQLMEMHPLITKEQKEEVRHFLKYYNKSKKATIVHTIINTCGNLVPYKLYLKEKDSLSDKFLTKSSMLTFEPVVDLELNFKLIYISDLIDSKEKEFVLLTLHKLYVISVDMYEEYSKVDIDTEQFVRAVRTTVEKLKKQIPRCDEAFKKILDSTELLRDNYSDYYKDFVGSQNSMIIAENFIQDVAGTVDRSPKLALQFRRIIQHLRDMTNKLVAHDPRYKDTFSSLLDHADNSYSEIKKTMEAEGEVMEDDEEEEEEDDGLKEVFDSMADNIIAEDKRKKEAGEGNDISVPNMSSLLDQMGKLSAKIKEDEPADEAVVKEDEPVDERSWMMRSSRKTNPWMRRLRQGRRTRG